MTVDREVTRRAEDDTANGATSDGQEASTTPREQVEGDAGGAKLAGAMSAIVVGLVVALAMAGLTGWLGYRARQSIQANQQRALFIETARQAAVNLTTLSYTEIEADIQRIVDSSVGSFRDDFQKRAPAFVEVVKRAQSKSVGTVTAAGLESLSGDQAQVLVGVSVKTSANGAPEEQPRSWRMRISVARDGDGAKVSNVQFVP